MEVKEKPKAVKNIFAVSLDSPKKHRAAAILFDNNRLYLTHCLPISGKGAWREELKEEIAAKANSGFVVIIEDRSGIFSPHANSFCFDDVHEGRTMLQHAFDWWFSMQNSGNLVLAEDLNRYAITQVENSVVDLKNDDKGRVLYVPEWDKFHGAHKALLLCVVAAMMEPLSDHWFERMLAAFPPLPEEEWNPLERWGKSMGDWEEQEQARIERMRAEKQARIDERDGIWPLL